MNLPGRGAAWRAPAEAGLLAMVVALAGCSNSSTSQRASTPSRQPASTPASPPAPADSCAVITRAQAAHALGHAVGAPVRGRATVEGGVACVYYGPGAPARANPDVPLSDSVRVVLVRGAQAKGLFNDYRARVSAQPIAGLGDQAYYDGYASLSVLKGDAYVRIAVIGVPDVVGAEEQLAAKALPRM